MYKSVRQFNCLSYLRRHGTRPFLPYPPWVHAIAKNSRKSISISSKRGIITFSKPNALYPSELASAHSALKTPRNHDPDAWVDVLEPFLPGRIRRQDSLKASPPAPASHRDFLSFLIRARNEADLDLLWHLGVTKDRWAVVLYIIRLLAERWVPFGRLSNRIQVFSGVQWPKVDLETMTESGPIELDQAGLQKSTVFDDLDAATANDEDPRWLEKRFQQHGFGQMWRSVGNMILTASTSSSEESKRIMPHVLEILAVLHHHDLIPVSVYKPPSNDASALQQPPTLHLLSSRILTSLSDAALNAHVSSARSASSTSSGTYSQISREIPGSRPKVFVDELGHEVWLELVLWSCLHGGWVADGAAILRNMQKLKGTLAWSLICWKDVLQSSGVNVDTTSSVDWLHWQHSVDQDRSSPAKEARRAVERTITSEVVAAYVDGLINIVRVGVGDRGISPNVVLDHIKVFKELLDKHNMGLGFTTWEGILVRFFESGSISLQNDPGLMLDVLSLIQPYGKELESVNLRTLSIHDQSSVPAYIFEPSAAALGLLHRVIRSNIDLTDVDGALNALAAVQVYTDLNKRRSLEAFFRDLRESNSRQNMEKQDIFSSNIPPKSYPSFFPELPITVLCGLLELLAEARMFRVGDHLLYSKDIDGPLIPPRLYAEPAVAASIIRYGTLASRKKLLEQVLKESAAVGKAGPVLSATVLHALLESQIQRRQWNLVENILNFVKESRDHAWRPVTVAILAREMLLLQQGIRTTGQSDDPDSLLRATTIFRILLQMGYGQPVEASDSRYSSHVELHSLLGVLSSINPEWAAFCAKLSTRSGSQPLVLDPSLFDHILDGAIAAFGLQTGKRLWDTWCVDLLDQTRVTLAVGGVPKLPATIPSEVEDMIDPRNRVLLEDLPTGAWEFRGRLLPRLSTLRIMLRAIMAQEGADLREWGMAMLSGMARDEEHVERELQRLGNGRLGRSEPEEA